MKDVEWKVMVRFVGRENKWAEHREDFSPGATHSASRVIDFLALKMGLETFEADAVESYYQTPEHEEVVVEPAPEYLERLAKAGRNTDIVWRWETAVAGETCSCAELGGTRGWNSCEQVSVCAVHDSSTVFVEFRDNGCAGVAHG